VIIGQTTEPQLPPSVSGTIAMFLASAAVLAILGNVAWSFFNRRSYDKLKETIAELKESIASKDLRFQEYKTASMDREEKLTLATAAFKSKVENLEVSNEAIVRQNLQLKAQLKQYRDVANEDEQ
jgi:hypothetical protein